MASQYLMVLRGHRGAIVSAIYSPDGTHIVTSSDGSTKIWDAKSGKLLFRLKGHTDGVVSARFSADGSRIVTSSRDRTARLWNARSGALLVTMTGHQGSLTDAHFSPDGKQVVTASDDGSARLWDVRWATQWTGRELQDKVCREKLAGARTFTIDDAADPILRGLDNANVCKRTGLLSRRYWARSFNKAVRNIKALF